MKTSYFANKKLDQSKTVSISRGCPKWYKGRKYMSLAPSWELVKINDEETFRRRYKQEFLDKLDPRKVFGELGEDSILLCWEKPGEFCHRRVVAEWLEEHLRIVIPEWEPEKKEKIEADQLQMSF